jgi:GNAT superfamily N-acetyltransferase
VRYGRLRITVVARVTDLYSAFVERAQPSAVTIEILADRPDLLIPLARLRWHEWRGHPGREALPWWVETTRRETGRDRLPITFVAADTGEAVGGVGLVDHPQELPELAGRGPWVVGTVVRADCRGQGIGTRLMTRLTQWTIEAGIDQLWVATGGRAIDFYRGCGFTVAEVVRFPNQDQTAILTASPGSHPTGANPR